MLGMVFEPFTDGARQVIVLAQDEARTLGHNHIGVGHLLLGLLREEAAQRRRSFEASASRRSLRGRDRADRADGGTGHPRSDAIHAARKAGPRTSAARGAFAGDNHIDTEVLLLALLSETDGPSAAVLRALGADAETIREMVLAAERDPSTKARLGRSAAERALKHIDAWLAAAQAPEQVLRAILAAKTGDAAGDAVAQLLNIERWLAELVIRQSLTTFTAEHVTLMQERRRQLIERLDPDNGHGAD
jgi:ATP-dependent Clp protease ATP-binding subunit ClpA